jgi:hypothetical protein
MGGALLLDRSSGRGGAVPFSLTEACRTLVAVRLTSFAVPEVARVSDGPVAGRAWWQP